MKKILIIIAILNFYNSLIKAQADTLIMKNVADTITNIEENLKQKHEYLDVNFREEKTLYKLGVSPLNFMFNDSNYIQSTKSSIYGSFIFERKTSLSWSIIVSNNFGYWKYYTGSKFQYTTDIGVRYYYNVKKRIKESIGANNFHCNYFSAKIDGFVGYTYQYYSIKTSINDPIMQNETKEWLYLSYLNLSWGIQRRIGKLGFVDLGPYIKFNEREYSVGANFIFGLGLGR